MKNIMNKKISFYGILFLILLSMSVLMVQSATVNNAAIVVYNINISKTSVNCDETVSFTARVENRETSQTVNRVYFHVLDASNVPKTYEGIRTSGTNINGTYRYIMSNIPTAVLTNPQYTFVGIGVVGSQYSGQEVSVSVTDAGFATYTCAAKTWGTITCRFDYTGITTDAITNNCTCTAIPSRGTCGTFNRKQVTYTTPEGCAASGTQITEEDCDYCDPLWTPYYSGCNITNQYIRTGTTSKKYTNAIPNITNPGDGSRCCGFTSSGAGNIRYDTEPMFHETGSDCQWPLDGGGQSKCLLDDWGLPNVDGSYNSKTYNSAYDGFLYQDGETAQYTKGKGQDSYLQPLIFDFDKNGVLDHIVENSNTLYVYQQEQNVINTVATFATGKTIVGQGAIYGAQIIDANTGGPYVCNNVTSCNVGVVYPTTTGLIFYRFTGSGFTVAQDVTIPGGLNNYAGVSCMLDACYVKRDGNSAALYAVKISNWNVDTIAFGNWGDDQSYNAPRPRLIGSSNEISAIVIGRDDTAYPGYNYTWICDVKGNVTGDYIQSSQCYSVQLGWVDGITSNGLDTYYTGERVSAEGVTQYGVCKVFGDFSPLPFGSVASYCTGGGPTENCCNQFWTGYDASCLTNPVFASCDGTTPGIGLVRYGGLEQGDVAGYYYYGDMDGTEFIHDVGGSRYYSYLDSDPDSLSSSTYSLSNTYSALNIYSAYRDLLYVDTNADGANELWYTTASTIYVYDENMQIVAQTPRSGLSGNMGLVAFDLESDGKVEVMAEKSDGTIAYFMKLSGNNIVDVRNFTYPKGGSSLTDIRDDVVSGGKYIYKVSPTTGNLSVYHTQETNPYIYYMKGATGVTTAGWSSYNGLISYDDDEDGDWDITYTSGYKIFNNVENIYVTYIDTQGDDPTVAFAGPKNINNACCGPSPVMLVSKPWPWDLNGMVLTGTSKSIPTNAITVLYDGNSNTDVVYYNPAAGSAQLAGYQVLGWNQGKIATTFVGGTSYSTYKLDLLNATVVSLQATTYTSSMHTMRDCIALERTSTNDANIPYYRWLCYGNNATHGSLQYVDIDTGIPNNFHLVTVADTLPTLSSRVFQIDWNKDGTKEIMLISSDNIVRVYSPSGATPPPAPTATTSYAECYDMNNLELVSSVALSGTSCKARSGITGFNNAQMFGGMGLTNFLTNSIERSYADNAFVVPVSPSGSPYAGVISNTGGEYKMFVPRVSGEVSLSSPTLDIVSASCNINSNGDGVTATVVASAPTQSINYYFKPGDGSSEISTSYPNNKLFYDRFTKTGNYTGTITVKSNGSTDTTTCTYQITKVLSGNNAGGCDMGEDGEFNWLGQTIEQKNWLFSGDSRPKIKPTKTINGEGILSLSTKYDQFTVGHTASCNKAGIQTAVKIRASEDADILFELVGVNSGATDSGPVWTVGLSGGQVVAYEPRSGRNINIYNYYKNEVLYINVSAQSNKKVVINVNGNTTTLDYNYRASNFWGAGIFMNYVIGTLVEVDYIRTIGLGDQIDVSNKPVDQEMKDQGFSNLEALEHCGEDTLPSYYSAKKDNGDATLSYPNILDYCKSSLIVDKNYCDYTDLRTIIKSNKKCTREVLNYCVDVAYPEVSLEGGETSGGDGTVVCTTVLGFSVFAERIAFPMMNMSWDILWSSPTIIMFVFIFIVVIMGIVSMTRRR